MGDNPDNKQICRLCLDVVAAVDAEAIGEKKKTILEFLRINIDLHVIENAVACSRCMEHLLSGFEFKSGCLHISAFVDANMPVDIKEVFHREMRGTTMAYVKLENSQICRLCMSLQPDDAFHCNKDLKDMLANCLPEVDIHAVHEPLVCGLCFSRMKKLNEFMTTCQEVERIINNYCQAAANHAVPVSVNLNDLLKFKDSTIKRFIKEECSNFDSNALVDREKEDTASIECEEIHIKSELESGDEMGDSVPSGTCINTGNSRSLKKKGKITGQCTSKGSKRFSSDGHMARHRMLTKEFVCDKRTYRIDRKGIFSRHRHMMTLKDKSEVDKGSMTRHIFNHCDPKTERKFKCDKCPYESDNKFCLRRHNLRHENKSRVEMYKCENCEYETRYKSNMLKHTVKHRDPKASKTFKCDKCPYETDLKPTLRNHNLRHKDKSEVEIHKCENCEFETMYKSSMTNHMLNHRNPKGERKFKCDKCSYETNVMHNLSRHNVRHKEELEMLKCYNCEYETRYKGDMKKHMMKHRDPKMERKFKCDECPYETNFKHKLYRHNLRHKDKLEVDMHKCDNCEFETKWKDSLNQHMLKHRDPKAERKFKCDKCPYETDLKCNLGSHILIHKDASEVQMHKCENCDYQTKRKDSLIQHALKHRNPKAERKFKCDTCPYETDFKFRLRVHNLIHKDKSEVEMYKCDHCEYESRHKRNMIRHIVKHRDLKAQKKI